MLDDSTNGQLSSEQHQARIADAARAGMDTAGLFDMISTQFEIEAAEGNFTPERHAMLANMLSQLDRCIETKPTDLAGMLSATAKLKAMMPIVAEARLTPSRRASAPIVAADSYQEILMAKFKHLSAWLGQQATAMNRGEYTNDALNDLYILRSGEIENAILGARNDDAARGVERELVRRFALEVKATALEEHLTIADPIWPTPSVSSNASGVFFSGFEDTLELLHYAVESLDVGLTVMPQTTHGNPAEHRWNQMRAAALCVFDMTRYISSKSGNTEHTKTLATVGYELGIALTLGRPIIVLADPSRPLPFDIDITPVLLFDDGNDTNTLMSALDDIIYKVHRTGGENSLEATRAQAKALLSKHPDADVRLITKHAFGEGRPDARHMRNVLDSIVDMIGRDAPCLLTPAWAGSYPSDDQRRCFHVTPFGPDWADEIRDLVSSSCQKAEGPVSYIRGDSVLDADIVRSIWNEICRATHVVVDVTGLNVNALMELGMAHTLGREVLLITQDADFTAYPMSLRKQRFHHYSLTSEGKRKLDETLQRFLDGHADPATKGGNTKRDKKVREKSNRKTAQRSGTSSVALSCPEALTIRAHIDQILQQSDGDASGALRAHAATLGIEMDSDGVADVRAYINCVPACVEGLHNVAMLHDQLEIVQPVLSTLEGYFIETIDLIADHHGLLGLLDDAYMAYAFIDELNNEFAGSQTRPLLAIDLAVMNRTMEPLLTDDLITMIRTHVQSTIEQNRLARQFKTAGKWLLGGLAAVVAWNVLGGSSSSASSISDREMALLHSKIYQ